MLFRSERRIAAQADLADRVAPVADRTIVTDGTEEETRERVEAALADALAPVLSPLPFREARR